MRQRKAQDRPRQAMREQQAEVSGGPRKTNAQIPADLMLEGLAERFVRVDDFHWCADKLDTAVASGDAIAELVVVAKIIDQRFEATNFGELLFRGGHHGAEHEIQTLSTEQPRDEDARGEIGAVAERFEIRGQAIVGEPAIEAGHAADGGIREWRGDRS